MSTTSTLRHCVICNDVFQRLTRGPVVTCQNDECKYLNSRVTRMNAARKQQGLGRACGRCGRELKDQKAHYCEPYCGPFQRSVHRRDGSIAGSRVEKVKKTNAGVRRSRTTVETHGRFGTEFTALPEPHRTILFLRFPTDGSVPATVHVVAQQLDLSVNDVIDMETEALEAMGAGRGAKRWRFR